MFNTETPSTSSLILFPEHKIEGNKTTITGFAKNVGIKEITVSPIGIPQIVFFNEAGATISKGMLSPYSSVDINNKESLHKSQKRFNLSLYHLKTIFQAFAPKGFKFSGLQAESYVDFIQKYSWEEVVKNYGEQLTLPTEILQGSQLKITFKQNFGKKIYIVSNNFPIFSCESYPQPLTFNAQYDHIEFVSDEEQLTPNTTPTDISSGIDVDSLIDNM